MCPLVIQTTNRIRYSPFDDRLCLLYSNFCSLFSTSPLPSKQTADECDDEEDGNRVSTAVSNLCKSACSHSHNLHGTTYCATTATSTSSSHNARQKCNATLRPYGRTRYRHGSVGTSRGDEGPAQSIAHCIFWASTAHFIQPDDRSNALTIVDSYKKLANRISL